MDFYEIWNKVLGETEIVRPRVQPLLTFADTVVPYIFLTESSVNHRDTLARNGEVIVQRPSLVLPPNIPQFEGFEFENDQTQADNMMNFLLIRGIQVPSLRYNNKTASLQIYEGNLKSAVDFYRDKLEQQENVHTGLILGPADGWQFSVLIYLCTQIVRNASRDLAQLMAEYRKKKN
jgi:hypothetical protein